MYLNATAQITAIHPMDTAEGEAVECGNADVFRSSDPEPEGTGGHVPAVLDTGLPKITVVEILLVRSDAL